MMHLTLASRMPIAINPHDVRMVTQSQSGTEIAMMQYPHNVATIVSESYDDVLEEMRRALM